MLLPTFSTGDAGRSYPEGMELDNASLSQPDNMDRTVTSFNTSSNGDSAVYFDSSVSSSERQFFGYSDPDTMSEPYRRRSSSTSSHLPLPNRSFSQSHPSLPQQPQQQGELFATQALSPDYPYPWQPVARVGTFYANAGTSISSPNLPNIGVRAHNGPGAPFSPSRDSSPRSVSPARSSPDSRTGYYNGRTNGSKPAGSTPESDGYGSADNHYHSQQNRNVMHWRN